jgi:hypothetical protein
MPLTSACRTGPAYDLDIYAHAITPKKLEAQGTFLCSLLAQGDATGLVQ